MSSTTEIESKNPVQQEPEVVLATETPKTAEVQLPARTDADKPGDDEVVVKDDGIMRVSNKEGKMRASVGYLLARLKNGQSCTLQAYGQAVTKAILMSSIIRTKLGDIHQTTSLCELNDDKRESQGVRILLSTTAPDDTADIGYQVAEPKGFWQRKRAPRPKKDAEKPAKSSRSEAGDRKAPKSVEPSARDKSSVSARQRSQSNRRARDKQSQTLNESKKPAARDKSSTKENNRSSSARRPRNRNPLEEPKVDKAANKPVQLKKEKEDDVEKPKRRRNNRDRKNRSKIEEEPKAQKENLRTDQRSNRKPKAADESHDRDAKKQRDFQKSWANDEDQYFYEGTGSRRPRDQPPRNNDRNPRDQPPRNNDRNDEPPRRGRGGYRGPPQYPSGGFEYPQMRAPYYPGQGYFMMRAPYYGQAGRGNYYNHPGYQKGHNTREIGHNAKEFGHHSNPTSHGG